MLILIAIVILCFLVFASFKGIEAIAKLWPYWGSAILVAMFYNVIIYPKTAEGQAEKFRVIKLQQSNIPEVQAKSIFQLEKHHKTCIGAAKVDDIRDIKTSCEKRDALFNELKTQGVCWKRPNDWYIC